MKIGVLFPDLHHPYQNQNSWEVILDFLKDLQPDEVVLTGDAMDMRCLNHHEEGNLRHFETKRLIADYRNFEEDIIDPINRICRSAKKIYMFGNHEQWVEMAIDKDPSKLEGIIEIENCVDLKNWKVIPYIQKKGNGTYLRGKYQLGKLTVMHGDYTNQYHAAKTVNSLCKSVAYGHTHDIQCFSQVTSDVNDYHVAWSIGCLCNLSPSYIKGRANKWVNGFAVVYWDEKTGNFNLYQIVISNNKFMWNGKLYKPHEAKK